jgi:ornithine lipid ester-linked acyl 2-hydroxylase
MFFDPADFAFTKVFEEQWQVIRGELRGLDPKILDIYRNGPHEQYVAALQRNNGWIPGWQVGSREPNYNWLTYGLSYAGLFPDEAPLRFPETRKLLARLTGFKVCAFLLMRPLSVLGAHAHPELGGDLLTYHLGLQVTPGRCFLWVDGNFAEEEEGKSIIFDGSHDHFAVNVGQSDRAILYMEFDKSRIAVS